MSHVARHQPPPPVVPVPPLSFDNGMTYSDYTPTVGIDTISALQTWLDSTVPNGSSTTNHSRVLLGAGRTYTGDTGLSLGGKSHITFEGGGTEQSYSVSINGRTHTTGSQTGGASFVMTGTGSSISHSAFRSAAAAASPASDIRFHAIGVLGNSTTYATTAAGNDGQLQAGFAFYGASTILIDHCSVDKNRGDGVYLSDRLSGSGTWCSGITIQNSHFSNNGRQGIAIIAATTVLVSHCRMTDIAMGVFDLEPNASGQGHTDVEMSDCIIDGTYYSWSSSWEDPAFGTNNQSVTGTTHSGYLRILRNGVSAAMHPANTSSFPGVFSFYKPSAVTKTATLTIEDNRCSTPKNGYILVYGGFSNGGSVQNNTGFKTASGTYTSDQGGNGSFTISGNT